MVENLGLSVFPLPLSKLAEDADEEPDVPTDPIIRHLKALIELIQKAVIDGSTYSDFFELGWESAGEHPSLAVLGPFLDAVICENAFDLVEAMSQTCGYEELKSFYATAFGLFIQGFADGIDRDLYIPDCTETEDGVESGPFHEFEDFDEDTFKALYPVW